MCNDIQQRSLSRPRPPGHPVSRALDQITWPCSANETYSEKTTRRLDVPITKDNKKIHKMTHNE